MILTISRGTGRERVGHALLALSVTQQSDTKDRIYVYDPTFPDNIGKTITYITVDRNTASNTCTWSYPISNTTTWGSGIGSGELSYVPYGVYFDTWLNRASKTYSQVNLMRTNSADFNVYNSEGTLIAEVRGGEIQEAQDGIVQMRSIAYSAEEDLFGTDDVAIWVPVEIVSIENVDPEVESFEVRMTNVEQSALVTTSAESVTFAVDDEHELDFVQIEETGHDYDITLESSLENAIEEARLTGTTGETGNLSLQSDEHELLGKTNKEIMSFAQISGELYADGVDISGSGTLQISGQTVTADALAGNVPIMIPTAGVAKVTLESNDFNMTSGEKIPVVASVYTRNPSLKTITWTSSDHNVATVDNQGNVTALSRGVARIAVASEDEVAYLHVTVDEDFRGTMGGLTWIYDKEIHKLYIVGTDVNGMNPVYVASYSNNWQMLSSGKITESDTGTEVADDAVWIKLFWLDAYGRPRCEHVEIKIPGAQ